MRSFNLYLSLIKTVNLQTKLLLRALKAYLHVLNRKLLEIAKQKNLERPREKSRSNWLEFSYDEIKIMTSVG